MAMPTSMSTGKSVKVTLTLTLTLKIIGWLAARGLRSMKPARWRGRNNGGAPVQHPGGCPAVSLVTVRSAVVLHERPAEGCGVVVFGAHGGALLDAPVGEGDRPPDRF